MIITKFYGAGSEADVEGDVNTIVAACTGENSQIEYVCGGSYKAYIKGSINLTITAGYFQNVYGGNDQRGGIKGNITVNVEETDPCDKPIIIGNLVGGGNQAPFPGKDNEDNDIPADAEHPHSITVNVKSATHIGNVYGGSFMAETKADTKVNINMIQGGKQGRTGVLLPADYGKPGATIPSNIKSITTNYVEKDIETGTSVVGYYTYDGANYHPAEGNAIAETKYYEKQVKGNIDSAIGTIGNVFGGGQQGLVIGNTVVNIGTETSVGIMKREGGLIVDTGGNIIYDASGKLQPGKSYSDIVLVDNPVKGAHITGDVYGGGELATVTGNTTVNIGAKYDDVESKYVAVAEGLEKDTIGGSVFGGGKGSADNFTCDKAMVGVVDTKTSDTYGDKGTHVYIGHGTIDGDVYGGGEIGRVEFDTKVTIGFGDGTGSATKSPVIGGYVFGAGQGVSTHGYSGLVRGNSTVTIQGDAKVGHSVYGAGKLASLGRYWIATTDEEATAHGVEKGMPYGLKDGGTSTVTIQGYAEIGPNDMSMKKVDPAVGPDFDGNVFGAGKGVLPYDNPGEKGPGRYYMNGSVYTWQSYAADDAATETAYLKYVKTLGITETTDVTITGNAFIKGSVYGGSENGHVRTNTLVKIQGGQIGCGEGKTAPYTPVQWTGENASDFTECASWDYGKAAAAADKYQPYDKYTNPTGDDGHTFYGNVFGGGSGYFPYKSGKWNPDAGIVGGSTKVLISGGHILTSVYGGNEMTDVTGDSCVVIMTAGTLGVPRTVEAMKAHPVTCYLFGGGKGDPRTIFNDWTNVKNTRVEVKGEARIFGSVFGGAEDGHVLGNTKVNILGNATIGTTGTSYVDGNIFGGGRGFTGISLKAGSIGGDADINISGTPIMRGSVYGGGRLASVGVNFSNAQNASSGQFTEDGGGKTYGHVRINISGGTIGNDTESATVATDGHTTGGNVFGGSMGRLTQLNGSPNLLWTKLA